MGWKDEVVMVEVALSHIEDAQRASRSRVVYTPMTRCIEIERELGLKRRLFFKWECHQHTGSFKYRGAFNALVRMDADQRHKGIVVRSSGNFAIGAAKAAHDLGVTCCVIMPSLAPRSKVSRVREYGAQVLLHGQCMEDGIPLQATISEQTGMTPLSSYDHPDVIAGQGVVALECLNQCPSLAYFLAPIGGGGLMAGCGVALKALKPSICVMAVEPKGAARYARGREAGASAILGTTHTVADGLRVAAVGRHNWPLLQASVDGVSIVSDANIIRAMLLLKKHTGATIEPSGAVSLASLLAAKPSGQGAIVCVISGGNIDEQEFSSVTSAYAPATAAYRHDSRARA